MTTETDTTTQTETLFPFRVRLLKSEVEAARRKARTESLRQGKDIGWCDLLREALKKMTTEQTPTN